MKSIYGELFNHYKNQKTKIGQKVFDVLNREGIKNVIVDGNIFWFEFYTYGNNCPEYVYNHIKKHLEKQGYTYLFDLEPRF